ncbi:helix-turn-helix domain-containing protein [Dactylosporangium sp. NPDC000521]|uniref:helix-turn-helix domain-containing protein n=1 Tax=Dactylosporangium sp. NPDC000521 TaxID=3363975 RepID=UPI003691D849
MSRAVIAATDVPVWRNRSSKSQYASLARYVHPNTFRYRLRRAAEAGPLDLHDPDARFAAMLELRLAARPTE